MVGRGCFDCMLHQENRVTSSGIPNNITHEIWYGRKPNIAHLRIFGSKCWYVIPKTQTRKLDDRSSEAMMIGYSTPQKGYKLWHAKLKRLVVSRDVTLAEVPGVSINISDDVWEKVWEIVRVFAIFRAQTLSKMAERGHSFDSSLRN
jgi:hypothetical protein